MTNLEKFKDPIDALYFFMEEMHSKDCVTCGAQDYDDHSYGCAGCFAAWLNEKNEVEPVKHGYWIWDECANMDGVPKCSVCGLRSHSGAYAGEDNYCPRCGTKMDGDLGLNEKSEETK